MKIEGKTSPDDLFVLLYQDTSNITSCTSGMNQSEGTSPCDDVLLIPIDTTQLFQFIKISTPNYLQLCEVQIFAGKYYDQVVVSLLCLCFLRFNKNKNCTDI